MWRKLHKEGKQLDSHTDWGSSHYAIPNVRCGNGFIMSASNFIWVTKMENQAPSSQGNLKHLNYNLFSLNLPDKNLISTWREIIQLSYLLHMLQLHASQPISKTTAGETTALMAQAPLRNNFHYNLVVCQNLNRSVLQPSTSETVR